jgi:hypothetical protein
MRKYYPEVDPCLPEPQIEEIKPESEDPNKLPEDVEQIIISTTIGNPQIPLHEKKIDQSNNLPN